VKKRHRFSHFFSERESDSQDLGDFDDIVASSDATGAVKPGDVFGEQILKYIQSELTVSELFSVSVIMICWFPFFRRTTAGKGVDRWASTSRCLC